MILAKPSHLSWGDQPKPIVLLVPGFAISDVLLGSKNKSRNFECTIEPVPVMQNDNDTYFLDLPRWLIEDGGFDVRIAYLENNHNYTPSIITNALCLRQQILNAADQSPTNDVIIIAHSMGGLVSRAYIQSQTFQEDSQQRNKPPVSKVILVAAPNQGMPFHFWLNLILKCESTATTQRSACEFSSSRWIAKFNETFKEIPQGVDFYTIGGTLHNSLLGFIAGSYICLTSGPNDGTIPALSSIGFAGARGKALYAEAHLPSVGKPSYFSEYMGRKSQAYINCIYPVVVEGDSDGCEGNTALVCSSLQNLIILILGMFILPSIIISILINQYFCSFNNAF